MNKILPILALSTLLSCQTTNISNNTQNVEDYSMHNPFKPTLAYEQQRIKENILKDFGKYHFLYTFTDSLGRQRIVDGEHIPQMFVNPNYKELALKTNYITEYSAPEKHVNNIVEQRFPTVASLERTLARAVIMQSHNNSLTYHIIHYSKEGKTTIHPNYNSPLFKRLFQEIQEYGFADHPAYKMSLIKAIADEYNDKREEIKQSALNYNSIETDDLFIWFSLYETPPVLK